MLELLVLPPPIAPAVLEVDRTEGREREAETAVGRVKRETTEDGAEVEEAEEEEEGEGEGEGSRTGCVELLRLTETAASVVVVVVAVEGCIPGLTAESKYPLLRLLLTPVPPPLPSSSPLLLKSTLFTASVTAGAEEKDTRGVDLDREELFPFPYS